MSVHRAGDSNDFLFEGSFDITELSSWPQTLNDEVKAALDAGQKIGGVNARISGSAVVLGGTCEENAFSIGASAFLDYVSIDLVTFSDAWMPFDLRGCSQPAVHERNAPRLSAALRDLSEVLDTETDPDDPTYFGKPTETGVENYFEEDGSASDVWGSFEIPYRNRVFRHEPRFTPGYKRSADGVVQYVPVRGWHGVLGYLWASDAENAASFEPRDDADEDGYKDGLAWLDRLGNAYDRGLSPSHALAELAGLSEGDSPDLLDLASLREKASGTH
ncbi:hypothetical protein GCM10012287_40860 [Streptomyces daqingensis]|uniref:Uncharacterized protein n=1 Tax=Streptomyces daqingensis TaxID=1472640 RepID=A0ABQ2MLP3_9ACTN|nr:hypothetical protein GCM10012287_40860 [Streptomyces daqingensis]